MADAGRLVSDFQFDLSTTTQSQPSLSMIADPEDPMRVTDETRPLGLIVSQHNLHPNFLSVDGRCGEA